MVRWQIGTYARLRPPRRNHENTKFTLEKLANGTQTAALITFPPSDEDEERIGMKQRESLHFQFNDIFDATISQDHVFTSVCQDIVYSTLDGYNGTILAYGQTGSGKTYTITGGEHYGDRGIIPRVLSTIFEEFEKRTHMRYSCFISFLEIYNETVYDLLDRSHTDKPIEEWTKVLLMDDDEGEMHFRNLGVYEANSEEEALNLLFLGNMNRITSETPMNQASSRSHSIFTLMIEARPIDSDVIVTSKLHLVDLAGSERVYKREGTQRMRTEGKYINLSLHHLEQVILSLRMGKRNQTVTKTYHVPYRNSMLTSVLRGSLGGNCKSVFIATLNPESEFMEESISTCRFMQRCSEVCVEVAQNTEVDVEKRIETLEKMNKELEQSNQGLQQRQMELEHQVERMQEQIAMYEKEQKQWDKLHAVMEAQQQQLDQVQSTTPVEWTKCEELVEELLVTGDVPREALVGNTPDMDDEHNESTLFYQRVMQEIRRQGMDTALACLTVMKETTVFASNTAAELQEMMTKQKVTVEVLEKRLLEQKQDAEHLKRQMKDMMEHPQDRARPNESEKETTRQKLRSAETSKNIAETNNTLASDSDSDSGDSDSPPRRPPTDSTTKAKKRSPPSTISLMFTTNGTNGPAPIVPIPPPAPTSSSSPTAQSPRHSKSSGSEMIRRRMELLKTGALFVKYGRYGKPHERFVWCSMDLEYLNYRLTNSQLAKASIPTRSIQRIVVGQQTKVFERARDKNRDEFCFSIEYDESRTLDLAIPDGDSVEVKKQKRNEWTEALQFLIKLKSTNK